MKSINDMNLAEVTLAILSAAVNIPDGMYARAQYLAKQELRALLDKPDCEAVTMEDLDGARMQRDHQRARADRLQAELDELKAAQHQGEPVALQHMAVSEGGVLRWMTGRKMQDCELYAMPDWSAIRSKLFAEPPAPVAVVMPEKQSVPEPEDYNTNIDEVAFAEGYNDALDDVARLNRVNK